MDPTAYSEGAQVGAYRVERLLARGGQGVLYVAEDQRLARRVVLKVLPRTHARQPGARERLRREARLAASLRHPAIVSIHALEEHEQNLILVTEFVEGRTLAQVVAEEGPLPRARWLAVAQALADALATAHAASVLHRDVKASNVVLGSAGVRLVDFGIAVAEQPHETRLTQAGSSPGTPLAQAPEQLEGGQATAASDQFAFGLLLYELASGRHAFGNGPLAQVWSRMLRDEPTPLATVAPQLSAADIAVVHRCLAREPAQRFASMDEVRTALAALGERVASETGRTPHAPGDHSSSVVKRTRWWDLHQAATSLLYIGMLWPGWLMASTLPGRPRAFAHLVLVVIAAWACSIRLHLWFGARHYPRELAASRVRLWPLAAATDVIYAALMAGLAIATVETRLVPAAVSAGLAACLLMATVLIEPATRRASHP